MIEQLNEIRFANLLGRLLAECLDEIPDQEVVSGPRAGGARLLVDKGAPSVGGVLEGSAFLIVRRLGGLEIGAGPGRGGPLHGEARGIGAGLDHAADVDGLVPGSGEGDAVRVAIDPEREALLLALEAIGEPPPSGASRLDDERKPAAIGKHVAGVLRPRRLDLLVGQLVQLAHGFGLPAGSKNLGPGERPYTHFLGTYTHNIPTNALCLKFRCFRKKWG